MRKQTVERISWPFEARLDPGTQQIGGKILARVDALWDDALAQSGPSLFNGKLFSISARENGSILGHFVDYKLFKAQRMDPSLHSALGVRPLGVTGLIECYDGFLFGRRGHAVEQNPDEWEFAPSGGIDESSLDNDGSINLPRALLTELSEEIGLAADVMELPPVPFAIIEDHETLVTDVVLRCRTRTPADEILRTFEKVRNTEYTALAIHPISRNSRLPFPLASVSQALFDIVEAS